MINCLTFLPHQHFVVFANCIFWKNMLIAFCPIFNKYNCAVYNFFVFRSKKSIFDFKKECKIDFVDFLAFLFFDYVMLVIVTFFLSDLPFKIGWIGLSCYLKIFSSNGFFCAIICIIVFFYFAVI